MALDCKTKTWFKGSGVLLQNILSFDAVSIKRYQKKQRSIRIRRKRGRE